MCGAKGKQVFRLNGDSYIFDCNCFIYLMYLH